MYGYTSKNSHWEKVVYGDGLDRKLWSRYFVCPMKYNRVVIFRSNLWHSHNYNFGKDISDGRLVQLFFFNPINFLINEYNDRTPMREEAISEQTTIGLFNLGKEFVRNDIPHSILSLSNSSLISQEDQE